MTPSEYVGRRIRTARHDHGWSQAEFGALVGELLGLPWVRQAVSAAEKGRRSFTVAELFAIADVLDIAPGDLVTPPTRMRLTLPSGRTLVF